MNRISSLLLALAGIILLINGCSGGCSNREEPGKQQLQQLPQSDPMVLVIKNRRDETSAMTASQLTQSFDYTNIPYSTLDLGLLSNKELEIPESVRLVCITTSEVEKLDDQSLNNLLSFVAKGNSLFTTTPVWDQRFAYFLGLNPNINYQQSTRADGFKFNSIVFPGFENGSFNQSAPYYHRGFNKTMFTDDIEVLATSKDSLEVPVIIERNIGEGRSVFFNSQIGHEKSYRGLLFSLALKMLDGVAYPVANASTIFLDDFPAPLYDEKMPPIDWEYDMTHGQFVSRVWWPEMKQLADKYNIDYSAMITFNYNANVVPPFDFNEWTASGTNIPGEDQNGSIGLAKDVVKSRHELAFHGYNHFSLWLKDWPNEEFMLSAVKGARKRWRIDGLGPMPVTYVPPTNLIDSTGLQALTNAMPQLEYMSSLYLGELSEGTGREFSADPYNPHLFNYPRISSGFTMNKNSLFSQQSLYLLTGIWTHFVHPDDVFQVDQRTEDYFASRNERGLGWHKNRELDYGLYELFEQRIRETIGNYPFIRFRTASDAAPLVQDWTKARTFRKDTAQYRQVVYNLNAVQRHRYVTYNPSYWFLYVTEENRNKVEKALSKQVEQVSFTRYWDGYLAQFSTFKDTLLIPSLDRLDKGGSQEIVKNVVAEYANYQNVEETVEEEPEWTDTRLKDALAQLQNKPGSRALREKVIELAVEFNRLDLALKYLEKRLALSNVWRTEDIKRLVTYYSWAGETDRAWAFLEKLWKDHQDQSVIALKEMMVEEYGVPGTTFRDKWLKRELELNPKNEQLLRQLVLLNQSQETWPITKRQLQKLLQLNPASDTLYRYSLQRSLWYGNPDSTLQWLNSFPATVDEQLRPLAGQIAKLYAYTNENYNMALEWARGSESISTQTRLQWLQLADKEDEFRQQAREKVNDEVQNDSLRTFVGTEFIYNGDVNTGFSILYPLFEKEKAPENVKELVHTEIGYQSYEQKKSLYKQYPEFFTEEMRDEIQHQFRTTESVTSGVNSTYASDNFGNRLANIGLTAEWGNRNKWIHSLTTGQSLVKSDLNSSSLSDQLATLHYQYKRNYRDQTMQSSFGAGLNIVNQDVLPELRAGLWVAVDSTFTSGQLSYSPVMTNTAINQDIDRIRGTLYREDYWFDKNRVMTTFSGTANWYSDEVFSYETLGRLYIQLPFSTSVARVRTITELSYSDATVNYSSGLPYWTPGNLFIKGAGIDIRYQDEESSPRFMIEAELMGKHNPDGFYIGSAARLNTRLARYLDLSVNAEFSSSELYRYNNVGFTVRYTLPKQLK